jgi:putative ABC transport system substrate-binding protein
VRRREFIALFGSALASSHAARAQRPAKPKIGVLIISNKEPFWSIFKKSLREFGYIEGENIKIELRSAEGLAANLPTLAAELVRLKVDVIVATPTPCAHAAKAATTDIPIVMVGAGDPVSTGLVASLSRPGGNVTGTSSAGAENTEKTLELFREILPSMRRVAILVNPPDPFAKPFIEHIERAAKAMSMTADIFMIHAQEELDAAFAQISQKHMDAVVLQATLPRKKAADLAIKYRLPITCTAAPFTSEAGGLLSYSFNVEELYRKSAVYVDKILKGAKPTDLPVQEPTKFTLSINLKTAKAIGITIPPTLLARADEVIE